MTGLRRIEGKYVFTVVDRSKQVYLNLYKGKKLVRQIPFDPLRRVGDVWSITIDEDISGFAYAYQSEGRVFSDPCGTVYEGRKRFGNLKDGNYILKTPIKESVEKTKYWEEWDKDRALEHDYADTVIYKLHVRGFTRNASSGIDAKERGTFRGIIKKIPYMKELGITAIELLPPYEFNEVMLSEYEKEGPFECERRPIGRVNYWGFTSDALMMAPKSSYTSDHRNPKQEFQELVMALHQSDIEVIIDVYYYDNALPEHIARVIRYWRVHYHIDGVHLIGNAPLGFFAKDPYLSRFKIWADCWEGCQYKKDNREHRSEKRVLANYNDGFRTDMRRILKGDEDMLGQLMLHLKENPLEHAEINYFANNDGLSFMDMLSYDRKHNEANQEDNRDGADYNYSWNCGEEGRSRKKNINKLRRRMWRNAWMMLMLSQGTPLINAGDEFGMSRQGNNNAYCQDNALNWLDWTLIEKEPKLFAFAQYMIAFRKKHGVFRQENMLQNLDYRSVGIPDISFHGETAWRVDMENYRRQLGMMLAGDYAGDDSFLVLFNMHWESHAFRLAHPPVGKKWVISINSADDENNGIYPEGNEPELVSGDITLEGRAIVVLRAVRDESYIAVKKNRHERKSKK